MKGDEEGMKQIIEQVMKGDIKSTMFLALILTQIFWFWWWGRV